MADNFQSSKVASNEQSSSSKFNNFVQAVEDAINSLDNSNIGAAAAILVSKLAAGSNNDVLTTVSGVPTWQPAAGSAYSEISYVEFTSPVTITATSEGAATTIVTAGTFSANGTAAYVVDFFAPRVGGFGIQDPSPGFVLYLDGSSIGRIGDFAPNPAAGAEGSEAAFSPVYVSRRIVPSSGSRTFSIRAYHSGTANPTVSAGAGGSGNRVPGFIRVTKVT